MQKDFWVAFIASFILFVAFVILQKYLAALILLLVVGFAFRKRFKLDGFLFFYLLKSKLGIKEMKKFSKKEIFSKICDIGFFVTFGLSSLILRKPRKLDIVGLLILILLYFSLPFYSLSFIRTFSNQISPSSLPEVQNSGLLSFVILISFFVFGIFGFIFVSLIISGFLIFQTLFKGEKPTPGVMPVIPGYNIPLLSGILVLFIVLSVHEFAHGVISISKKVRVKSTGLLLVGVLPIGAFVENDEKKMEKIKKEWQNQILIAGITANFLLSLLFLPLVLYLQNIKVESYVVVINQLNSSLKTGDIILKFGNFSINSMEDLKNAEDYYSSKNISNIQLTIKNSSGVFTKTITTTKSGKIGIYPGEEPKDKFLSFILSFVELSFFLNFMLGATNLLPIPGLDGHKLLKNLLGKYSKILEYITIFLFLLNLLPLIPL
jgi:membrane-associated protease RseP (regulator of RpoE activity)